MKAELKEIKVETINGQIVEIKVYHSAESQKDISARGSGNRYKKGTVGVSFWNKRSSDSHSRKHNRTVERSRRKEA